MSLMQIAAQSVGFQQISFQKKLQDKDHVSYDYNEKVWKKNYRMTWIPKESIINIWRILSHQMCLQPLGQRYKWGYTKQTLCSWL